MDMIELERNMLMTMPGGWKMSASRAHRNRPTTYAEFKKEILNEIARCLNMPYNIAAGNSSGYNYASGRLDHQTYYKSIRVDQAFMAEKVLDRVLAAWFVGIRLGGRGTGQRANATRPPVVSGDGHEHVGPGQGSVCTGDAV
jgi:hypothetical protein